MLERAREILRRNIRTLRGITNDLYPVDLDTLGLAGALTRLAGPLRERGIEVTVRLPDATAEPAFDLDRERTALVYRVARESFSNIVKHSGARAVELSLTQNDFRTVLIIRDDGFGFDPTTAPAAGHLGLRILRDTVDAAGGSVKIESSIGGGTTVLLSFERVFPLHGR